MKKVISTLLALTLLAVGVFTSSVQQVQAGSRHLLEFETMVGVPRPYTGSANPIRNLNGGGLPWVVRSANGELSSNGNLEVKVNGLVLDPNDAGVIAAGRAGMNPIASFFVVVSCQSVDATGAAVVANVSAGPFPATIGPASAGGGNAKIETRVSLPKPCIAPIVFVGPNATTWFASTGN
jgi:hypothetical protein